MRFLVTGGAGFIGSNVVDYLLKKGHFVRVLDNLVTGNKKNIEHNLNNSNFEFIYGDICNLEIVRKACKDIDAISHQAALGSVPRSIDEPLGSHQANINGFLNILVGAKENAIKRIVYASSSAVYGDETNLPKREDRIGKPLSPYAITKYVDELYGKMFTDLYNMECIGFRYFNVFGPRQDPNGVYAAVIPKFIDHLKRNTSPTIHGDGQYSRDFTYVENVVEANYLGLTTTNDKCFGEIFNIGAGGRVTILEMYQSICKIMGVSVKPVFGPIRKGDIPHSNANIEKANLLLNFTPTFSFEDGIRKYLENQNI
jgi:UDP-N-acetylglucosamine/UDP-N-acetylgalactosamine 4-epimerase